MKLNLNRNKRYAIPIMTHPGIELIEKTVKTAVTDGQTHADAIIALSENTPSDAATGTKWKISAFPIPIPPVFPNI